MADLTQGDPIVWGNVAETVPKQHSGEVQELGEVCQKYMDVMYCRRVKQADRKTTANPSIAPAFPSWGSMSDFIGKHWFGPLEFIWGSQWFSGYHNAGQQWYHVLRQQTYGFIFWHEWLLKHLVSPGEKFHRIPRLTSRRFFFAQVAMAEISLFHQIIK